MLRKRSSADRKPRPRHAKASGRRFFRLSLKMKAVSMAFGGTPRRCRRLSCRHRLGRRSECRFER